MKKHPVEDKNTDFYNQLYGHRSSFAFKLHALFSFDQKSKSRPLSRLLRPLIDELHPSAKSNAEVLDYGCGWGQVISALPPKKIAASIFDISDACLNHIQRVMRLRHQASRVTGENLGVDHKNQFHLIICSHVLEHVPSDRTLLSEFYSSLKKGGYLVVNVPINEVWDDPKHMRKYTPETLQKLIAECGFQVISENQIDRWTAFILGSEVKMNCSWISKIVFKPLRCALAILPYPLVLLLERICCSRYPCQQNIVVSKKVEYDAGHSTPLAVHIHN